MFDVFRNLLPLQEVHLLAVYSQVRHVRLQATQFGRSLSKKNKGHSHIKFVSFSILSPLQVVHLSALLTHSVHILAQVAHLKVAEFRKYPEIQLVQSSAVRQLTQGELQGTQLKLLGVSLLR